MPKLTCTVVIKAKHPKSKMHKKGGRVSIWGVRRELSNALWASHGRCSKVVILNGMKLRQDSVGSDGTARFTVIG